MIATCPAVEVDGSPAKFQLDGRDDDCVVRQNPVSMAELLALDPQHSGFPQSRLLLFGLRPLRQGQNCRVHLLLPLLTHPGHHPVEVSQCRWVLMQRSHSPGIHPDREAIVQSS